MRRLAVSGSLPGIRLKDVRLDIRVGIAAHRADLARRHRRADLLGERRARAPTPVTLERSAFQRGAELRALERGAVTGLTIERIGFLPTRRLLSREFRGRICREEPLRGHRRAEQKE